VDRADILRKSPIITLDPIKKIDGHNFTYSLNLLKRNPKAKMNYKKAFRAKNELTTSQGRPIFNSQLVYRHYLKFDEWNRAAQLPPVLANFERNLYNHDLIAKIGI
jgi:hypothetical protein